MTGFGKKFTGRWEDGWISAVWQSEQSIPPETTSVAVSGKHWAPIGPIALTIKLEGKVVHRQALSSSGDYAFVAAVPPELSGKVCRMSFETSRTSRPKANGDYRQLGCVVDTVQFQTTGSKV